MADTQQSTPTFGWVMNNNPPRSLDSQGKSANEVAQAITEANERCIQLARSGFDTIWLSDHFQGGKQPMLEAITTLSYLAGKYPGLRYGHIVLAQSYRNPALTAKMAANLQALTHGNFILGIGAGWKEDEYRAYGYDFPPPGVRVDQLEEAVQVIKAMWTQSPANFEGKYYTIKDGECQPQPDPPVPLMIGGAGEKKTLRVVAKYADWWNHDVCTAEQYAHKQVVLAEHCREVGRDPASIVHTYRGFVRIVDNPAEAHRPDDYGHVIGGSPQAVADELRQFIALGVQHIQVSFLDYPDTQGLERFIAEVLPLLRD